MHDILEARCVACGFALKGVDPTRAPPAECPLCACPMATRSDLAISRRLPVGLGLLMGAFAASLDASPLRAPDAPLAPGFARMHGPVERLRPPPAQASEPAHA